MKTSVKTVFFLLTCLCITSFSYAQKNERKGFFLGIGIGPGLVFYDAVQVTSFNFETEKENKVTFITDFKIGYAPTNQLAIYWTSKVAWFNTTGNFSDEEFFTINGFGGVGASYFLKDTAPSPYFNVGIGYSSWSQLNIENAEEAINAFALGLSAGAGYEFARHWSAEVNLTYGKPSNDNFATRATAIRLTINYLLY
jgi:hypothetical protein